MNKHIESKAYSHPIIISADFSDMQRQPLSDDQPFERGNKYILTIETKPVTKEATPLAEIPGEVDNAFSGSVTLLFLTAGFARTKQESSIKIEKGYGKSEIELIALSKANEVPGYVALTYLGMTFAKVLLRS